MIRGWRCVDRVDAYWGIPDNEPDPGCRGEPEFEPDLTVGGSYSPRDKQASGKARSGDPDGSWPGKLDVSFGGVDAAGAGGLDYVSIGADDHDQLRRGGKADGRAGVSYQRDAYHVCQSVIHHVCGARGFVAGAVRRRRHPDVRIQFLSVALLPPLLPMPPAQQLFAPPSTGVGRRGKQGARVGVDGNPGW